MLILTASGLRTTGAQHLPHSLTNLVRDRHIFAASKEPVLFTTDRLVLPQHRQRRFPCAIIRPTGNVGANVTDGFAKPIESDVLVTFGK